MGNQPRDYKQYYDDSGKKLFCTRFLETFDFDRCINMNIGRDHGTWCYVDATCETLNGGSKINDQFSWKICSHGDSKLRDYGLEGLYTLAWKAGGKVAREEFGELVKL